MEVALAWGCGVAGWVAFVAFYSVFVASGFGCSGFGGASNYPLFSASYRAEHAWSYKSYY